MSVDFKPSERVLCSLCRVVDTLAAMTALVAVQTACVMNSDSSKSSDALPSASTSIETVSVSSSAKAEPVVDSLATSADPRRESSVSAAKPEPKPSPELLEPSTVIGRSVDEAKNMLGTPGKIADMAPAVVWSYFSDDCELSLHFYMDISTRAFRVLTYNVVPEGGDTKMCFTSVQNGDN